MMLSLDVVHPLIISDILACKRREKLQDIGPKKPISVDLYVVVGSSPSQTIGIKFIAHRVRRLWSGLV